MARPKGKLLALVLIFGAITVVTATGAFTTVEAERTAEVNVTGDANALLGLTGYEDGSGNTPYARTTDDGQIVMVLGENMSTGQGASGINANANTTIQNAITVTNQGNQDVDVTLSVQDSSGNSVAGINMIWSDDSTGSKTLTPGTTETFGIEINLLGSASEDDLDDLTIVINATAN